MGQSSKSEAFEIPPLKTAGVHFGKISVMVPKVAEIQELSNGVSLGQVLWEFIRSNFHFWWKEICTLGNPLALPQTLKAPFPIYNPGFGYYRFIIVYFGRVMYCSFISFPYIFLDSLVISVSSNVPVTSIIAAQWIQLCPFDGPKNMRFWETNLATQFMKKLYNESVFFFHRN